MLIIRQNGIIEEWRIPITTAEQAESVLKQAFTDANDKIAVYYEQIKTIQDFKELVQSHEPVNNLNCILCDIALGNYERALDKATEELSNKHSGGFSSIKGGDIYEYVQRYCKKQLYL